MQPTHGIRIGVVTTGHGPRDEYVHYHGEFLRALGGNVQVVNRHIYEGLTVEQITPHQVGKEAANIGAHVHVPGATGNQMGDGWEHRFYALPFAMRHVQGAIDLLEQEDGVKLIILACAAEMPTEALRSNVPLIHPRELLFGLAETLAHGSSRRLRMGVIVDAEHAEHDRADWERRSWFDRIELVVAPITRSVADAAAELGRQGVDYAFYFGYGVGLAPRNAPDMIARLEAAAAAPLILPHRVTTLFVRNLVPPALDDNR
ncbi:hypothetical protein EN935_37000, partial [Mesorhizobium sp. M7D.F.Ca.US.004.03.1.1]|uniref:AroM family protein n=1 Tax=Mesorhizobium sp. M7D.F.Ca.US.004.03.1.1 TaxID=2496702 RepID=UPI000FD3D2EA